MNKEKIINEIFELSNTELLYLNDLPSDSDCHWKYFVAYRIRTTIIKRAFDYNQKNLMFAKNTDSYEELEMHLTTLYYTDYCRGLEWDSIDKNYDFSSILENEVLVKRALGYEGWLSLKELMKEFNIMNRNSKEFIELYNSFRDSALPLFKQALDRVLDLVDYSKSNQEIASFVNIAMTNDYYTLKIKSEGKVRVKHKNKYYFPVAEFKEGQDIWLLFMGKTFKHIGIEPLEKLLTRKQFDFLSRVYEISQIHYENRDMDFFRFNHKGRMIVNNKHIAKEVGMSEPNYTQTMKRINLRINSVWEGMFENYLTSIR